MAAPERQRILFVGSECFPLIKTGGLADVMGALPLALEAQDLDVRTLIPGFPSVMKTAKKVKKIGSARNFTGIDATILAAESPTGQQLLIADAPHLFAIEGNPYLNEAGQNRADNGIRYAAFAQIAAEIAMGRAIKWQADTVHCHDWQAGLTAAYLSLEKKKRPRSLFTIHNLAFQGLFPKGLLSKVALPETLFNREGLEFWDQVSFLKAGLVYSDFITTVSPTYAREICTEEGGMGLGGLLKSRSEKLAGITNGIDTTVWNPETDPAIVAAYNVRSMGGKAKTKSALQKRFGLSPQNEGPLLGVISRLTDQKGLDLVARALPHIVGNGAQLVVLGSGDAALEKMFREAAGQYPEQIGVFIGYDEPLAHQVQAGTDCILVPSRFEPCGLTQLCAMRYGTVPLVSRVGGLADTVIDASTAALRNGQGTGIQFSPVDFDLFVAAMDRLFALYADQKLWATVRRNGMKEDVSWAAPAAAYRALYQHPSTV